MRLLISLLLLVAWPKLLLAQSGSTADDANIAALPYAQCLIELDSLVALATNETRHNLAAVNAAGSLAATIDRSAVDAGLAELEARCPPLPQLAHNRGVLAAKVERWPEAIAHLERSLSRDPRASETYQLLQNIYEYQASLAYARALNTPVNARMPRPGWQDSTHLNADANARLQGPDPMTSQALSSLRSISTVEYELYSWWQAQQTASDAEKFYVDGFPAAAISQSRRFHSNERWEDIHREIAFTASDAVAVLGHTSGNQSLLLLRLVGTQWKIYQETRL